MPSPLGGIVSSAVTKGSGGRGQPMRRSVKVSWVWLVNKHLFFLTMFIHWFFFPSHAGKNIKENVFLVDRPCQGAILYYALKQKLPLPTQVPGKKTYFHLTEESTCSLYRWFALSWMAWVGAVGPSSSTFPCPSWAAPTSFCSAPSKDLPASHTCPCGHWPEHWPRAGATPCDHLLRFTCDQHRSAGK